MAPRRAAKNELMSSSGGGKSSSADICSNVVGCDIDPDSRSRSMHKVCIWRGCARGFRIETPHRAVGACVGSEETTASLHGMRTLSLTNTQWCVACFELCVFYCARTRFFSLRRVSACPLHGCCVDARLIWHSCPVAVTRSVRVLRSLTGRSDNFVCLSLFSVILLSTRSTLVSARLPLLSRPSRTSS